VYVCVYTFVCLCVYDVFPFSSSSGSSLISHDSFAVGSPRQVICLCACVCVCVCACV